MHSTFLEDVLDDLEKKGIAPVSCTFILPSKRSGTFLKKHIAQRLERSIFAPQTLSIQEYMEGLSGLKQANALESLLQLYASYRESGLDDREDFSSFVNWGQALLQDFIAIDGHLLPAGEVLNYLAAIKELDHWSLQADKTPLMESYLKLWSQLAPIYDRFRDAQIQVGRAHQGLIHRMAVAGLSQKDAEERTLVFIGFNALNRAESTVIQHALEGGKAHIYWDIDPRYLEDPIHEAGYFIRKYLGQWPYYQKHPKPALLAWAPRNGKIQITGVPKNISQTKYAGKLLGDLATDQGTNLLDTALVLADESLLDPMLKAIPPAIGEVNITMGLPLEKTLLYTFFLHYLELCLAGSSRGWFHGQVLEFLANPNTLHLSGQGKEDFAQALAAEIKGGNHLYLLPEMLEKYRGTKVELLFPQGQITPEQWIGSCLTLIQDLREVHQAQGSSLDLEYLYRFHTLFNQLAHFMDSMDHMGDLKSIRPLFKQLAAMESLDFIGEPLSGLQIMGMLESRNLDFGTVIITSVNEGILPAGKSNNSFIPFDVKQQYGLPTHKERDAIYTYHFYRLIQRASQVHILYNTEADVLEGGERSRLIAQLLTDPVIGPRVDHRLAAPKVQIKPSIAIQIEKSDSLMADLIKMAETGFSPSSLTNYVRNPLDFYQQNLLKIDEVGEVEEKLAANRFGNIVHQCLEVLYRPLIGGPLEAEGLKDLFSQLPSLVTETFQRELPGADLDKGWFLLTYRVMLRYLENFLKLELEGLKNHSIELLAVEQPYLIPIDIPGLDHPINLKGTLDRVDRVDGQIRIIDYKTGQVKPGQVVVGAFEELITDGEKAKAFQLLCYAYIYRRKFGTLPAQAAIISFKNLGHGPYLFHQDRNSQIEEGTLDRFEIQLHALIREILDPSLPLTERKV